MKSDAERIMNAAISSVMPGASVKRTLEHLTFGSNITMIAIGKAAFPMGEAAICALGDRIRQGIVLTKYGHAKGTLGRIDIYEAAHPIPDENSLRATEKILQMVGELSAKDEILLMISGGGSSLFEKPKNGLDLDDIISVNAELLKCGANIHEINTIRKRLSAVKGGRFAKLCEPAKITSLVLSDVISDRLDDIASGIAVNDGSTSAEAFAVIEKYKLDFDMRIILALKQETPRLRKQPNTIIIGNIEKACYGAGAEAEALGYKAIIVNKRLTGEAKKAGEMLGRLAKEHLSTESESSVAFILGGETTVQVKGRGVGGRSQELALSAAAEIAGLENVCVFSFGTDGTDGPTDAAGGFVNGGTKQALGSDYSKLLSDNDSYNALKRTGGLLLTGPTGTNVNDLSIALCRKL